MFLLFKGLTNIIHQGSASHLTFQHCRLRLSPIAVPFKMYCALFFISTPLGPFMCCVLKVATPAAPASFGWIHQHLSMWLAHFQTLSCVKVEATGSCPSSNYWGDNFLFCHSISVVFFCSPRMFPEEIFLEVTNFFVSLLAEETRTQCSWLNKCSLSPLLSFFLISYFVPSLPHLTTYSVKLHVP